MAVLGVAAGTFPGMPFGLGIWEILILAGVLVLLFGAKGAPAMARRLGTGVREMKDAVTDIDPRSVFDEEDEPRKPKPMPAIEAARPDVPPSAVDAVVAPASASDVAPEAAVPSGDDDPPAPQTS